MTLILTNFAKQNSDVKLSIDDKKLAYSLTPDAGDEDLSGLEMAPTLAERREKHTQTFSISALPLALVSYL